MTSLPPVRRIVIRPASVADAGAIALVHVRSWQVAYRGLVPQDFLDRLDPARRREFWEHLLGVVGWPTTGTLVAARSPVAARRGPGAGAADPARTARGDAHPPGAGAGVRATEQETPGILGFASICPSRDDDGAGIGELASLYVDPPAWRQDVGHALSGAAVTALARAGFTEATLWVLQGNAGARAFYRAVGWNADGLSRREVIGGAELTKVRYRLRLPALD